MELKASEWIMIVAVLIGPVIAVITQLYMQQRNQRRDQKLWIFNTLMSLRATTIAPDYVRALNCIDVMFFDNSEVRNRWKKLLEFYDSDAYKPDKLSPATLEKSRDLLAELLAEIGHDLGFRFEHTHIKNNAYYPRGLVERETQLSQLRQFGLGVLSGISSVNVRIDDLGDHQKSTAARVK